MLHAHGICIAVGALAVLSACGPTKQVAAPRLATVTIAGTTFQLEVADTDADIDRGLGGRAAIPADGGMLFVFPDADTRFFVMRDCPTPLDLIYLDDDWRVISTHVMLPEPPRRVGELDGAYDARLKSYISDGPARRAIEVAGGTISRMSINVGDVVEPIPPR